MKANLLKRMAEAEQKAVERPMQKLEKLFSKMTIAELRECVEDDISDERLQEIVREAAQR